MIKLSSNNIGKIYLGSNPIGKAYYGSDLVFQKGSSPTPPTQSISYIRGGADGSYIDTGITPDSTTRVIVWARNFNPASGFLFGSRVSTTQDTYGIVAPSGANTGRIRIDYAQTNTTYANDQFANLSGYHKYELYQGECRVDDVTIASATPGTFSNNFSIHLINVNSAGVHDETPVPIDICACKIYKNGTLVRDYSAVSSPNVGLYDSVSNTVFTNAGTGNFTYGTFNPNAYTPLEYITTPGGAYFSTNIYGTYSLRAVAAFMPTGTTANFYRVLGCRGANSTIFEFATGNTTYRNSRLYLTLGASATTAYTTNTNDYFKNKKLVATKADNTMEAYYNNNKVGSTVTGSSDTSFSTGTNILVGGTNNKGTVGDTFVGNIYYILLYPGYNLVPARKGNNVGLYDTYNDVFYKSESETDFVAGPELPTRTHFFRNKKIAIIGDSISTYDQTGYKYDSYRMYYPAGDVDTVDETWWKRLIDTENCTLDVNLAYSGSFSSNYNSNYPTFYDRTSLIGDADIIIVAIGTNDSTNSVSLGTFDYTTEPENLDMSKFRESYIKGIRSLMTLYPSVSIVCAIFSMGSDYRDSIKTIAEHYELDVVDCGNDYEKYATVHPNTNGMIEIYNNFLYV